jgi:hypothetical protein
MYRERKAGDCMSDGATWTWIPFRPSERTVARKLRVSSPSTKTFGCVGRELRAVSPAVPSVATVSIANVDPYARRAKPPIMSNSKAIDDVKRSIRIIRIRTQIDSSGNDEFADCSNRTIKIKKACN